MFLKVGSGSTKPWKSIITANQMNWKQIRSSSLWEKRARKWTTLLHFSSGSWCLASLCHPLFKSLTSLRKCVSFSQKVVLTTCLLNGRRQRETAIYQQNRHQCVSVDTDRPVTVQPHHMNGWLIKYQMSLFSSQLLFGIKLTLWLLSAECLQQIPQQTSPHAKRWPVHSPGDSRSRLKSRLTLYDLVIFIWPHRIATTAPPAPPPHSQGVKLHFTQCSRYMGHYHAQQLLGKIPDSLSSASGFFSHSVMELQLFSFLLLLGALDINAGENYYFSISAASPTCTAPLIYSWLYSFPLLFSSFVIPPPIPPPVCLPLVLLHNS